MADKSSNSTYGAKAIQVMEGLEAVRKRPAMYIGSTGPGGFIIWCMKWLTTRSMKHLQAIVPKFK